MPKKTYRSLNSTFNSHSPSKPNDFLKTHAKPAASARRLGDTLWLLRATSDHAGDNVYERGVTESLRLHPKGER